MCGLCVPFTFRSVHGWNLEHSRRETLCYNIRAQRVSRVSEEKNGRRKNTFFYYRPNVYRRLARLYTVVVPTPRHRPCISLVDGLQVEYCTNGVRDPTLPPPAPTIVAAPDPALGARSGSLDVCDDRGEQHGQRGLERAGVDAPMGKIHVRVAPVGVIRGVRDSLTHHTRSPHATHHATRRDSLQSACRARAHSRIYALALTYRPARPRGRCTSPRARSEPRFGVR